MNGVKKHIVIVVAIVSVVFLLNNLIAIGKNSGKVIELYINDKTAKINGEEFEMDVVAQIIDNRTMVPLRFVAEITGADVKWDDKEKKVIINYSSNNTVQESTYTEDKYTLQYKALEPIEYTVEDKDVMVSDKVIYELKTLGEGETIKEYLQGIYKVSTPNKVLYLLQTKYSGIMSHGLNNFRLVIDNEPIPFISGNNNKDIGVWTLGDKFVVVKCSPQGSNSLIIYNLETYNQVMINEIIQRKNIGSFEVKDDKMVIIANRYSPSVGIYEDEFQTFELDLDEILPE